ncbi:MAG: nucleotidyl transferase AbiEii/AbiGii toxin family protein [Bacteroidia bacterium]|jgi:hypothetical protein|nr:nucleotidyl transferase AbiEii/AbiGii toxin family protein [Bacteroidia bacterium]
MLQPDAVAAGTMDLLKRLAGLPELSSYRLAGGTALALQIGHRISYDLDFFSDKRPDLKYVEAALLQQSGMRLKANSSYALFLECNGVKIDVINYPEIFTREPVLLDGIPMTVKEDIAIMKLKTIMNRGLKRDFYDLFFLLEEYPMNLLLTFFFDKYSNVDPVALFKSLTYFEDAESNEPPVLLRNKLLSWEEVKLKMISETQKLL